VVLGHLPLFLVCQSLILLVVLVEMVLILLEVVQAEL
jgi:hypothetical protein